MFFERKREIFQRYIANFYMCIYSHLQDVSSNFFDCDHKNIFIPYVDANLVTMMYNLLVHDIIPLLFGKIVQKDWCSRLVEACIIDLSL